ncbi:unnamed protein product, partial [Durusdinium trenchii]
LSNDALWLQRAGRGRVVAICADAMRRALLLATLGSLIDEIDLGLFSVCFTLDVHTDALSLFAAAVVPVSQSLVSENVPETGRGKAFSILAMCAGLAGSASAFLYGMFTWQFAYRIMGRITLMLAIWIFIIFPADAREKPQRGSFVRELGSEMEQLKKILSIPSFWALLLGGLVGCIPWNALSFTLMYLQSLGFSATHAASLLTVMSVGKIAGSLLGGLLGDRLASWWPLHGRAFVGQMSILLGAIPLCWVLRPHNESPDSLIQIAVALFLFSLLAVWCQPGVFRPLWSELVPAESRGKIIGWWRCMAGSCGAILGGPMVGYMSMMFLGYKPRKQVIDIEQESNAESLGTAMLLCTMLPWALCFCCYSAIHFTYLRYRASEVVPKQKGSEL